MAVSKIKQDVPFTIVATANANQTYRAQMTALHTAYKNIPFKDRFSVLLVEGEVTSKSNGLIYQPVTHSNDGMFSCVCGLPYASEVDIYHARMSMGESPSYKCFMQTHIASDGTITHTDLSETTNTLKLQLIII